VWLGGKIFYSRMGDSKIIFAMLNFKVNEKIKELVRKFLN
jgi:hypothetical protein